MRNLKQWLFKSNGTITLFAALSMTFLIIFFMVLVDIARLFLFSKVTESSTKLAAQSVMSAYDFRLYEKYGLFGRGGTDGREIAEHILKKNLYSELNIFDLASPINLVPVEINNVDVMYDYYLGQHDELEFQIMEEMKYKAPIDFTMEVIESFAGVEEASQIALNLVDHLKTLQDLFDKREAAIAKALDLQYKLANLQKQYPLDQNFSSIISGYSSYISNLKSERNLNEQLSELLSYDEEELSKQDEAKIKQLEKELYSVQQSINSYVTQANKSIQSAEKNQQSFINGMPPIVIELEDTFHLAKTLNTTISIQYETLLMKQQTQTQHSPNNMTTELQMPFSSEQLIRSNSYFSEYEQEINEQVNTFESYISHAATLVQTIRSAVGQPNISSSTNSAMTKANSSFSSTKSLIINNYVSPATILQKRELQNSEFSSIQHQLSDKKKDYKDLISQTNYISQLAIVFEQLEKDRSSFDKVHQNYKRNMERNLDISEQQLSNIKQLNDDGNINAKESLNFVTSLMSTMKQSMTMLQSHLFRNEYTLQRFKHIPIGHLEQITSTNKENINFQSQAVEYIMVGFSEPTANINIILSEIFLIRLAIRTIEGLIANKHLAHPLLILSASIVHGLKYAIDDMNKLLSKGHTELSKYIKVNISYSLYLRLLFNLHGLSRKATLSRISAVIEHDLQLDLMQVPTSTIVTASTKTRLWMLPSISKLIAQNSSQFIGVENGYYEKYDYASSSY